MYRCLCLSLSAALVFDIFGCSDAPLLVASDTGLLEVETAPDLEGPDTREPADTPADTGPLLDTSTADASDGEISPDLRDANEPAYPPLPEPRREGFIRKVSPELWQHMDDFLLRLVKPTGIKVYAALLDANHYRIEQHRARGQDLIRHPQSFLDNAVAPFVSRYKDVLWAVDCMNEPEAMTAGADAGYEDWGVSWDEMRGYLRACADTVHAASGGKVLASAGSGWHGADNLKAGRYNGLNFDFLDFHAYSDSFDLPRASTVGFGLPVIIGECGHKTEGWDDARQLAAVKSCITDAAAKGYMAALSWYYGGQGSTDAYSFIAPDGAFRPVIEALTSPPAQRDIEAGLNLAWIGGAYDHDFANNPLHPEWGQSYDPSESERVVADYVEAAIPLMRLWVFEGQEGLPFSSVYSDFEDDDDHWLELEPFDTLAFLLDDLGLEGEGGLVLDVDAGVSGWQGLVRVQPEHVPLDLSVAREWVFIARNDLDVPVGINLAFTTEHDGLTRTYQTRPTDHAQLWLEPGASTEHVVSLEASGFSSRWALDSAPEVGVERPPADVLRTVRSLQIRTYLDGRAGAGSLSLDAIRIR